MSRAAAALQATAVARTFAPSMLGYENPVVFKHLALVDVRRSRDSVGRESWLVLFRYLGRRDAACVWVRRATTGPWRYAFEETQSVAWGRAPERVHDRCTRAAFRLRLLDPETDDAGSEIPIPVFAYPTPMSPFGPVAHGSYLADLEDTGWASLSGVPAKFPQTTTAGTVGVAAFVLDERTERVIPSATITVRPSTRLSGFFRVLHRLPAAALAVKADRHGAFVLLDLPVRKYGYDLVISAPGYAPRYEVHDLLERGFFVGDYSLARRPRFTDDTPGPPPCGAGC
jgi:hypothetical protein